MNEVRYLYPQSIMTPKPKIRLYVTEDLSAGAELVASEAHAHYLGNVMRRKAGDEVALFNGRDGEWRAHISSFTRRKARFEVAERLRAQEPAPDVWLLFAPIKRARLDFIAEKATELGVGKIQPVMTRRTNVDRVKTDRMRANAIEAAEQCEGLSIPEICEAEKLGALLRDWNPARRILMCDEARGDLPLLEAVQGAGAGLPWAILIGPEGGLPPKNAKSYAPVPLRPRPHLARGFCVPIQRRLRR